MDANQTKAVAAQALEAGIDAQELIILTLELNGGSILADDFDGVPC